MDDKGNNKENYAPVNKDPFLRRALDAFGNMFALNICFVIGCLPIFTIGASVTALYAMCIRLQENEEETIVAGFIHEYKRSFKQATTAFLLLVVALVVMYGQLVFVKNYTGTIATFYKGVLFTEVVLVALTLGFLFPLISRFDNKLSVLIRNSLILAITYPGSWLKVALAWVAPIAICVMYPGVFIYIWYMWLLLIFGAIAYGSSYTIRKVIRLNTTRIEEAEEKKAAEEAVVEVDAEVSGSDVELKSEAEPEESEPDVEA